MKSLIFQISNLKDFCTKSLFEALSKSSKSYFEYIWQKNWVKLSYIYLEIFNFKTFRAEILQIFELLIWKINDFINLFWLYLTFKGIVAILILLVGVGVVLAVVFLTRKVEEPSKNFSLSLFTESSCSQFRIRK